MEGPPTLVDYYFFDRSNATLVHIGMLSEYGPELRQQEEYGIVRNSDWIRFLFGKQEVQVGDVPKYTIVDGSNSESQIYDLVSVDPEPSTDAVSNGFIRTYLGLRSSEHIDDDFAYSVDQYTIQCGWPDMLIDRVHRQFPGLLGRT